MRLIDADALLKKAHNYYPSIDHYCCSRKAVDTKDINEAPTIDAEPVKHGEWIGTSDGYADGELVYDMWECSQCGYDADGADEKPHWNYCPNCGAKMDGGKDT